MADNTFTLSDHRGGIADVIVLSSEQSQQEEDGESPPRVKRKVRRRLIRSEVMKEFDEDAASDDDRDVSSDGNSSNELTFLHISPTKKVFTPTKTLRVGTPSDDENYDEIVKEGDDDQIMSDESLDSEESDDFTSDMEPREQQVTYFKDDHSLPIYASLDSGYPVHMLVDALMTSSMPPERVCTVQPLGVSQNAAFVVDVDEIDFEDLKADDLGSWKGTGTKRTHFRVLSSGAIKYSQKKPDASWSTQYLLLTRRYYVHKSYDKYHRVIADIQNHSGQRNKYAMIQYWFDGPPIEIKVKPHGNSQSGTPFFCTAESVKRRHKEIARASKPTEALYKATQESGGEIEAAGMQKLPRNLQQMKNYRRTGHVKDQNILYSVMLQCKLTEGTADAFVRDVKAAPDPQCVLAFNWQIYDLARFLTDNRKFSVLTADTTYNLGEFYVTPTTYKHLMLVDTTSKKHPTMAGPILVHQRKNFAAFNYFASTLVSFNKKLQGLLAYGTDGDEALIEGFSHNFPFATQLRCFLHLKRNIQSKLGDRALPASVSEEFVSDIFGKRVGQRYEEGLVDSTSSDDFQERLQNCKVVWDQREKGYLRADQQSFFDYFSHQYSSTIENTMISSIRTDVGLGFPPEIFTTNSSESLNAAIKRRVNYKESEWPEFNESMKHLVMSQRDEVLRSSGCGQYRLDQEYAHLLVAPQQWTKMNTEQRKQLVKQFDNMRLRCSAAAATVQCTSQSTPTGLFATDRGHGTDQPSKHLSVSVDDSNISSLPKATLEAMWSKAEEYLLSKVDVVPAPGGDSKAKIVTSRSGPLPHFVQAKPGGQYSCDKNCLQWVSSQICAHSLVAAEVNGELHLFLQWYTSNNVQPNISQLAMAGLPAGRGRKGGIAKRKRSRTTASTNVVVSRAATVQAPDSISSTGSGTTAGNTILLSPSTVSTTPAVPSVCPPFVQPFLSSLPSPATTVSVQMNHNFSNRQSIVVSSNPSSVLQTQNLIGSSSNASLISSPVLAQMSPNTNPFYIRFIEGNIRICQGCRNSLRCVNGSIPAAPFDLCCARAEKHPYRGTDGILRTPSKEHPSHYHINLLCIRGAAPDFIPSSLSIPPDMTTRLTRVHQEYLRLVFGVTFS